VLDVVRTRVYINGVEIGPPPHRCWSATGVPTIFTRVYINGAWTKPNDADPITEAEPEDDPSVGHEPVVED